MLKNKKLKELASQYIGKYSLNLNNYNVLVPIIEHEPLLLGMIAGMSGANNIYMFDSNLNINKNYEPLSDELNFNIKFIGGISENILSSLNIILKDSKLPIKEDKMKFFAKKTSVISMFPENLDFLNTKTTDIDIEAANKNHLSIIGLDPQDHKIGLYQHFSHIILKRCYNLGLDVFKSKILLIGNGELLNCTLGLLKSTGAIVYVCNTSVPYDQSYILKHLKDLDAIIVIDYPQTKHQIIGSKGIIPICDIVDMCPLVKLIHICGKVETTSLNFGNISYFPEKITQDSINLNIEELGERGLAEIATASFKIAEDYLKLGKDSLQLNNSVVTYKLLNNSLLLGRKIK